STKTEEIISDGEEYVVDGNEMSLEEAGRNSDDTEEEEQTFEIEESQEEWLENKPKPKKKEFETLNPEELVNKQQKEVLDTSEVLGIPVSMSGVLLRTYNWNKERLFSEFFEDRDKVCKKAKIDVSSEVYV